MHGVRLVGLCVAAGGVGLLLYFGVYAGVGRAFKAAGVPEGGDGRRSPEQVAKTRRQTEAVMRRGVLPSGALLIVVGAILMAV